jgi:hypothetical protein
MSRGNRSSAAFIEKRRTRLLELKQQGVSTVEAEEILKAEGYPADRVTLWRDLTGLRKQFNASNREEFSQYIQEQVTLLTQAVEEVWSGELPPEAANSIGRLMDSIARLTGSNAPTKSIHATVKGPQLDALYLDIREVLLDLSDVDKEEALQLMREFAKSHKKPVVITTEFLTKGNEDAKLS